MAQIQFSLQDLLARKVPIEWHEAVAIVLEVAEWHERGVTRGYVPELADLALTEDGRLLLRGTGPRSAQPVRAFGQLLTNLLKEGAAPLELRLLADQDRASENVHATVEEFARALSFFARPNRAADLMVLSQRCVLALEREEAEEEFRRLKAKATLEEPGRAAPEAARSSRPSRRALLTGAAVVACVFAAAGAWAFRDQLREQFELGRAWVMARVNPAPEEPPDPPPAADGRSARRANRGAAVRQSPAGGEVEDQERAVSVDTGAAGAAPGTGDASSAAGAASGQGAEPQPAGGVTSPGAGAVTPAAGTLAGPGEPSPTPSAVVYREGDPGVTPPRFLRPQFPTGIASENDPRAVTVEILIDESGNVEAVRWLQAAGAYHERMMTSAMKAWRFAPALRDGKPVRFAKRMTVPQP